jgi:7,8-dihydropterin-6-yl-methyl-4-(beta-D-ribofuranosyl)aminobenzene 5'-phosphate synthase
MIPDLSFEINIVFDNKCPKPDFLTGFGFSALIFNYFTENYSLFDTGGNGKVLIQNIEKLKVNISSIKHIIISHNHFDHAGGLGELLRINPNFAVYVPRDNLKAFSRDFPNCNIQGITDMIEIEKNLIISGQFKDFVAEQSVFLKTKENEIIILIGCAHPGLEKFIMKARRIAKIKAIIGGFHGFKKLKYLENIEFLGACHCSRNLDLYKKTFPDQLKKVCLGHSYTF